MFKIFERIWHWLICCFEKEQQAKPLPVYKFHEDKPDYIVKFIDDLPLNLENNSIYIVGDIGFIWMIAFKCPCNCGEIIQLNLLPDAFPQWSMSLDKKNRISLYPSIWRKTGCKSHFLVKRGKIFWC